MGVAGQAMAIGSGRRPPADATEGGDAGTGRGRRRRGWGRRRRGWRAPQLLNGVPVVSHMAWPHRISACLVLLLSFLVPHHLFHGLHGHACASLQVAGESVRTCGLFRSCPHLYFLESCISAICKKRSETSGATSMTLNICTGEEIQQSTNREPPRARCCASSENRSQECYSAVLGSPPRSALVSG